MKDDNTENLIEWIYNYFENNYFKSEYLIKRAILCTTNRNFDSIYKQILTKLPNETSIFYSTNTPVNEVQAALYPIEFLNEFEVAELPTHE